MFRFPSANQAGRIDLGNRVHRHVEKSNSSKSNRRLTPNMYPLSNRWVVCVGGKGGRGVMWGGGGGSDTVYVMCVCPYMTTFVHLIKMGQCQCTDPFGWNPTPVPSESRLQVSPVQTSPNPKARKKIARFAHLSGTLLTLLPPVSEERPGVSTFSQSQNQPKVKTKGENVW